MRLIAILAAATLSATTSAQTFTDTAGDTPKARVEAAIAAAAAGQLGTARPVGGGVRGMGGRLALTLATVAFARDPERFHLFMATGPVPGVCRQSMPKAGFSRAVLEEATAACLRGFTGRARVGGGVMPAPLPATVASAPPGHAANWAKVSAVLFHATQMIGVGGIPYPDFEPLILFNDGRYMEGPRAALEDLDLAADAAKRPRSWGRWRTSPGGYELTDARGRSETLKLQDGQLFKAFPGQPNGLDRAYRRISGGGNSGLGGEMTIAASNQYVFATDGRFSRDGSFGAIGSGATSGVATAASARRGGGVGRYTLARHTLTLTHPDGRQRRHFFAFGSQGSPARPDRAMIFIDDSVYPDRD